MRTGARNKDERKAVGRCISGQSNERLVTQKRPPHQVTHVFKFTNATSNASPSLSHPLHFLIIKYTENLKMHVQSEQWKLVNRKKLKIQEQPSSLKGLGRVRSSMA